MISKNETADKTAWKRRKIVGLYRDENLGI